MGREIEYKFAVDDASAFDALVRQLDLPAREFHAGALQVNHLFDTPAHALRERGLVLRLREERGHYRLTLKGREERRSEDGILTERLEEEVRLPPDVALDVLAGGTSPREALGERLEGRQAPGLALLDEIVASAELLYVGRFENRRTRLSPVTIPLGEGDVEIVFELDQTRFPDGTTEYEIEAEVGGDLPHRELHERLEELLRRAGISWRPARSKAQRFFERLERQE